MKQIEVRFNHMNKDDKQNEIIIIFLRSRKGI